MSKPNTKPKHLPDSISITWTTQDVRTLCPRLNPRQAREVLHHAKNNHDSNIGITWDVLAVHIDCLFPENKRKEKRK